MSSSQPFITYSPPSQRANRRRKSHFTFKHLSQLALFSTSCPLRVIAHIDLDAFYAQCEMVRLGVPEDKPVAVQQWQGLIAINYPARKFGLSRHATITEAQKACPEIILQHVATWKEGDEKWAYHEDAAKHIATHKVSLDPYRLESRRILAAIKEALPAAPVQRVEKASIDEVFLDLSAQVHTLLLERYPELKAAAPGDDPTENLPAPPTTALDWNADALVDLDTNQTEDDDPDWDDVAMLIGSEIVRDVRASIRQRLKYTCSAGLARNKMLAKLGSGHKKPDQQTIIRNRAVQHFLSDFKFTKIRMLGGKLGDEVVSMFNTDTVKELLEVPLEQLKKLGEDTGSWMYQTIRGEDHSEVSTRTQIKSMLSAKSFRPSINTFEQGVKWLRIFVADIFTRLVEEGVTENKRRPKTINLYHRQSSQGRSKQSPIPQGRAINEPMLFELAKNLLAQVTVDGRAWPCSNLSLSVGGFEEGITGNREIGGFLLHGDEAKALQQQHAQAPHQQDEDHSGDVETSHLEKRRRIDDDKRINQFFSRREIPAEDRYKPGEFEDIPSAQQAQTCNRAAGSDSADNNGDDDDGATMEPLDPGGPDPDDSFGLLSSPPPEEATTTAKDHAPAPSPNRQDQTRQRQQTIETYLCPRCRKTILADQQDEHTDFHFAFDLHEGTDRATTQPQQAQRGRLKKSPQPVPPPGGGKARAGTGARGGRGRGGGRAPVGGNADGSRGVEKGQRRLAFG